MAALVSTRSLSGARAAMSAELASVRRDGLAVQSFDIAAGGIASAERLMADQESQRTTMAPEAAPAARPRTRTPRRGGAGGAPHAAANDNADMTFTAEGAAADDARARISDLEDIAGLAHDRSQQRRDDEINGLLSVEQARQDSETMAQDSADKERRRLDDLRTAHESYAGRIAELQGAGVDGTRRAAEFTNGAFESMGKAIGTHVQALIDGRESVGTALQGMLSDTLVSVGKEAVIQGGMEIAKGVAALAGVVTAPLAPGHFAAGAAFLAVGAAAGVAGAALAPSSGAGAPGARGNGGAGGSLSDRAQASTADTAPIVQNFYAPVIGGRQSTDAEVATRLNRYDDAGRSRTRREAA